MRYFILFTGFLSIFIATLINFYPDETKEFVYNILNKDTYVLARPNDYYLDYNFKYLKNFTDDVSNRDELINYIYYVINSGSDYADGECTKEYTNCVSDLKKLSEDEKIFSLVNNYVHPYNNFKEIEFTYDKRGRFSLKVTHIYNKEDIELINEVVDSKIQEFNNDNLSTREKIKRVHDFIIDSTKYDELKKDNINDNTYASNTAYGVLLQGYGICSGYSDTMAIFLNKLGIENYRISNSTHIWNLVYVNGVWVHLDATWDDPINANNLTRDTYFLVDYNTLMSYKDDTHNFNKTYYLEAY